MNNFVDIKHNKEEKRKFQIAVKSTFMFMGSGCLTLNMERERAYRELIRAEIVLRELEDKSQKDLVTP